MLSIPTHNRRTTALRVIPLVTCSLGIIYFGTRRSLTFPGDEILSHDKLMHAMAFGLLSVLAYRCLRYCCLRATSLRAAILAVSYASVLGVVLELIQATLPYRSMEFADFVADAIGASLCVVVAATSRLERELTCWRL